MTSLVRRLDVVTLSRPRTSFEDMTPTTTPTISSAVNPAVSTEHDARPDWLPTSTWPYPLRAIDVDGDRIVYTDTGGDGPVLLLSHASQWSLLWGGLIAELSPQYRCVAFDAPGSGLSDRLPAKRQNLTTVTHAIGELIDQLDLRDVTLVLHDLGGVAALAAAHDRLDRISAVVAINCFGWRPRGVRLPLALRFFGSSLMREFDAWTGMLPKSSSTRFGVGRHMDRATKKAWRRGTRDRSSRRTAHRLFRDAAHNRVVLSAAERAVDALADRPMITIFGSFGDYFGFQKQWRHRHPGVVQRKVKGGYHFPMCDNPALVARQLDDWLTS